MQTRRAFAEELRPRHVRIGVMRQLVERSDASLVGHRVEGLAQCVRSRAAGSRLVARDGHGPPSTGAAWKAPCSARTEVR